MSVVGFCLYRIQDDLRRIEELIGSQPPASRDRFCPSPSKQDVQQAQQLEGTFCALE